MQFRQYVAYLHGIHGRNRKPKYLSLPLVRSKDLTSDVNHNHLAGLAIQAALAAKVRTGTRVFVAWSNVEARPDGIEIHDMRSHDLFSLVAQ